MRTVYVINFVVLFFISPATVSNNIISDYDKLCSIITETRQNKEFLTLNLTEQSIELTNKIMNFFPKSSKIISAFSALNSVNPQEKYAIFKKTAEKSLSEKWDCPSYKDFNESLIKPKKQTIN